MERDWHDEATAKTLANNLREYWAKRGYAVHVEAEQAEFCMRMRNRYWVIRSDMKNGLPTKRLAVRTIIR